MEQMQEENEAFAADYERLQRELAQAEEAMNNFREQVGSVGWLKQASVTPV